MKTKEEIEQLANEWANGIDESYKVLLKAVYIKGYNQCQDDMVNKKYTFNQITDAITMAREIDGKETYYKYSMEQILLLLNKQDI